MHTITNNAQMVELAQKLFDLIPTTIDPDNTVPLNLDTGTVHDGEYYGHPIIMFEYKGVSYRLDLTQNPQRD